MYDQVEEHNAKEALKISNKQWEAAIKFLVNAYWTKSEILESQGKVSHSIKTLNQVLQYFDAKMLSQQNNCSLVVSTKSRIKQLTDPEPMMARTQVVFPKSRKRSMRVTFDGANALETKKLKNKVEA